MNYTYKDCEQISKRIKAKPFELPKFGKSTTDPTYYEPSATRIANMKKASGMKLEGIYDFYNKDDVTKFNEQNFENNISNAQVDIRFNNKLLPEEVSQIATTLAKDTDEMLENKKAEKLAKKARIDESLEINKQISAQTKDSTEE